LRTDDYSKQFGDQHQLLNQLFLAGGHVDV